MEMNPRLHAMLDMLEILIGPVAVNKVDEEVSEVLYARLEA